MTTVALTQFQRWAADALREAGAEVPAEVDPLGLTFEAEGRVARIFPHTDEALAVIEVTALSLADIARDDVAKDDMAKDDMARLALALLRLNHEARFEHGWSIVIDDDNQLDVTTTVAVADTRAGMLGAILYDGIDRAKSLSSVVAELRSAPAFDPENLEDPGPALAPRSGAIRG
jgi:hypothetical protein